MKPDVENIPEDFESSIDEDFTTEQIGKTTFKGMRYPCITLDGNAEIDASLVGMIRTLSKPVVRVVKGEDGVERKETLTEGSAQNIALYLDFGDQLNLLGMLNSAGVTTLLELMYPEEDLNEVKGIEGWLQEGVPLKGNNLLILRS